MKLSTDSEALEAHLSLHLMEKGAQGVLTRWFSRYWEMDVAALNRNGYFCEYEIKVSRDDFTADLRIKKQKHVLYTSLQKQKPKLRHAHEFCYVPAQFYYVCYGDLIHSKDVPSHAGLLSCDGDNKFAVIKKAPKLHAGKPDAKTIAKFYRCMSWRQINTICKERGIAGHDDVLKGRRS